MRLAITSRLFAAFPVLSHNNIIAIYILIITTSSLSAQRAQPPVFDPEYINFSIREFDLRLYEPNSKERMICDGWCDDKVITLIDTIDVKYNFDLHESLFYINMNNRVLSVKRDYIKSFIIDGATYINYRHPQPSESMILELLVKGRYDLYKHHGVIYRPANFDPVLNVGNRVESYQKKHTYYAFCDERLIKLSPQIKKTIKILHQKCDTPKTLKVKGDIVDLFEKINSEVR